MKFTMSRKLGLFWSEAAIMQKIEVRARQAEESLCRFKASMESKMAAIERQAEIAAGSIQFNSVDPMKVGS
jgi:hypothetical protein